MLGRELSVTFTARADTPEIGRLMHTLVVDHPLVAHKLTALRDETTDSHHVPASH